MTSDRSTGRGLRLQPLWTRAGIAQSGPARGGELPPALGERYGSPLAITLREGRPTIVSNFVESLDGVVALAEGGSGGGEISGFFEPDRLVMGLLRALADAVVVGAGTMRNAPTHEWTPRRVNRAYADAYEGWRRDLELAPQPTTILVTGSGDIDPRHPALTAPDVPVIVATTGEGARRLGARQLGPHVRVEAVGDGDRVAPGRIVDLIAQEGFKLALCEGGPHLMGDLLSIDAVDELFLTLAPQLIGRADDVKRLAFIEGFTYPPGKGRWLELVSVHRAGDHLFFRHRVGRPGPDVQPEEPSRASPSVSA